MWERTFAARSSAAVERFSALAEAAAAAREGRWPLWPPSCRPIGKATERLKDWWVLGFFTLFIVAAVALVGAMSAILPALLFAAYFGGDVEGWIIALAPLWAPVWIGYVAKDFGRYLPKLPLNKPDPISPSPYA